MVTVKNLMVGVATDAKRVVDESCVQRFADRCEGYIVPSVLEDILQTVCLVEVVAQHEYFVAVLRFSPEIPADQVEVLVEHRLRGIVEMDACRFLPRLVSAEPYPFESGRLIDKSL